MWHWIRAGISAAVVALSYVAREVTSKSHWHYHIYAFSVLIVFISVAWELKPDRRINKIRQADLDSRFQSLFENARNVLGSGKRLPFRVNLMVPQRAWFRIFRPVLKMVYSYEMKRTDPDYGIAWRKGHGLCWVVYKTGRAAFAPTCDPQGTTYNLTPKEKAATAHVKAVLSLPVRTQHLKQGRSLTPKVAAVLNVDAISDSAAQELEGYWRRIESHENHPLVELADYAGLYC